MPDAPVLHGHEGAAYVEIVLMDDGDRGSRYRVAEPVPPRVVNGGIAYVRADDGLYWPDRSAQ